MVTATSIKRVRVWSGALRLAHWLMAFAVLVLLGTGWLLDAMPAAYQALLDYHYLAGYVLIAGVLIRLYLLFFGHASDRLGALLPGRQQLGAVRDMLRFYLSFGRWRLPAWYAHNPLWKPLYLVLLALLVAQILSGVFAAGPYLFAGRSLPAWHALGASLIGGLCGLHIAAVFLHDLKGTGSDASAMISGYRIFVIEPLQQPVDPGVRTVTLTSIDSARRGDRGR